MEQDLATRFFHVTTWVFDLDNTLYHPSVRLFDQISDRMRDYICRELRMSHAEADRLRAEYWAQHGTTLAGLMTHHDIDPMPFLHEVHDIDFSALEPDPDLRTHIAALPGRKIIYTNGDAAYAGRVLEGRGLADLFDAVYGVEHANFRPKPEAAAFNMVFEQAGIQGDTATMFEDDVRNLEVPHALGFQTVLVHGRSEAAHIHHQTQDLTGFLSQLLAGRVTVT